MISCGGRFRSWRRAFLAGKAVPRRRVLPAEGFGRGGELRTAESFAPRRVCSGGELRAAKSFAPRRASLRGAHLQPDTRRPLSSAVSRPPDLVPRDLVSCIPTSIVATHHRRTAAACAAWRRRRWMQWARWWTPAIGARRQGVIPRAHPPGVPGVPAVHHGTPVTVCETITPRAAPARWPTAHRRTDRIRLSASRPPYCRTPRNPANS